MLGHVAVLMASLLMMAGTNEAADGTTLQRNRQTRAFAAATLNLDQVTEDTGVVRDVLPWHNMFQTWQPSWSGPLARIDLLMGSKSVCH